MEIDRVNHQSTSMGNKRLRVISKVLGGLCEVEASYNVHLPTCAYNLSFHNRNFVQKSLQSLGFHPECRDYAVLLIRRK
jgi:hypothetical protein